MRDRDKPGRSFAAKDAQVFWQLRLDPIVQSRGGVLNNLGGGEIKAEAMYSGRVIQ